MSADNWAICPRCARQAVEAKKRLKQEVVDSYGKVTSNEYLTLVSESKKEVKGSYSLREDYEIGIHDAEPELFVSYSCKCSTCGFSHDFRYTEPVIL